MLYHINLSKEMLKGAKYAILPGDPGRVEKTAKSIDPNYQNLAFNREYKSALCSFKNQQILVLSTGIGGPSVAIAIEELARLGIEYFIRIGTSGAIQEKITIPSLIITTGSVRLDGASSHYAPIEYPAVADFSLVNALVEAAKSENLKHFVGITASSDTFYPGQERYDTFRGYVIKKFQKSLHEWQQLNVLNYEMESATLYTVCNALGLKAACVSSAIVNRSNTETPDDQILDLAEKNLAIVVRKALEIHIG